MPQPEVLRQDARLSQRLPVTEAEDPSLRVIGMLIHGRPLPICRDLALHGPPQVVHRVELRALLRQPDQLDTQASRQGTAPLGVVARGLIQYEVERTAAVAPAEQSKELLEVRLAHLRPSQDDPMSGPEVDRPEQDALGVLAGDWHLGLLAPKGPHAAQRREPSQGRLVLEEDHGAGFDPLEAPHDSPFFWARCGSLVEKT